jgi:hypothetical protein
MNAVWDDLRTLRPGVIVHVPEANEPGRIEASSGTSAATSSDGNYDSGAMIPNLVWQDLSREDRKVLLETDIAREQDATVRIVTTSTKVLDRFHELREIARYCDVAEACRQVTRPVFCDAMRWCAAYARDRFGLHISNAPGSIAGGIRVNAANLRTVTVHPHSGKFVGLHVDNWSRLPLQQRRITPQRICINLGNDARYLLFLNLSIAQLLAAALRTPRRGNRALRRGRKQTRQDELRALDRTACGTVAARIFMASSPMYPVIRLKVYPGEAYIAPTESIIHDGSSIGVRGLDLSLSLRERS